MFLFFRISRRFCSSCYHLMAPCVRLGQLLAMYEHRTATIGLGILVPLGSLEGLYYSVYSSIYDVNQPSLLLTSVLVLRLLLDHYLKIESIWDSDYPIWDHNGGDKSPPNSVEIQIGHIPNNPCMVYLPTFTIQINQMWVDIPYMDDMGSILFNPMIP